MRFHKGPICSAAGGRRCRQLAEEESGAVSTRLQGRHPDSPSPQAHVSLLERHLISGEKRSHAGVVTSLPAERQPDDTPGQGGGWGRRQLTVVRSEAGSGLPS